LCSAAALATRRVIDRIRQDGEVGEEREEVLEEALGSDDCTEA